MLCSFLAPVQGVGRLGSVSVRGIEHVRQKPDFCGEACLEMMLTHLGVNVDQNDVFNSSGLDPALGRGCATRELVQACQNLGIDPGPTWFSVKAGRADTELDAHFRKMHADLQAGSPSVVCMRYDKSPNSSEHFRLVVGYDSQTDQVLYLEPAETHSGYRRMDRSDFLRLWPLKYRSDVWTVIRLRMKPEHLIRPSKISGFSDADYAQHVRQLRQKLPGRGFTIVIEKPFIVVGDEAPEVVYSRAKSTVGWAVEKLKAAYFSKDPKEILDVWLFRDESSYTSNTRKLFGESPSTPYGYYSSKHKALVMNIATGGGTLVHEIVHPFMEANFPGCPDWFNEGLASLYEQSQERNGEICGSTNWRLAGLQRAIQGNRLQDFRRLTSRDFYSDDDGSNYAMARYLCYYLQETGKLRAFYQAFRQSVHEDPTGYSTLAKILGSDDMAAFQADWQKYVLELHFPGPE
ncbi:C39 family peptidase [bacterium]|nr:C39 family peptidase [bacterium]